MRNTLDSNYLIDLLLIRKAKFDWRPQISAGKCSPFAWTDDMWTLNLLFSVASEFEYFCGFFTLWFLLGYQDQEAIS